MNVGQHCKRAVVSIPHQTDVVQVAKLMRAEHIGFVIVYREGDEQRRPIGVVTDRDIVLEVLAKDVNPHSLTAEDIMTRQPLVAEEADELSDALQAMRLAGIRRVPVVDDRGGLSGILAIDDALDLVTGLMCDIAGSIRNEQKHEWRARPA
ncbi:MAG TPA: CBS domain-containing protein [Steroidobacteraceae bacterium]|jgi:CBS domain-containing protein|nr:CBS domain-containing protein [Steroidobacteraceae bacterium]